MPVQIRWDNAEKTIVVLDFEVGWTWEELFHTVQESYRMLDTVQHTVDNIINLNQTKLPSHGLTHTRNLIAKNRSNVGVVILVTTNPLISSLWSVLEKVYGAFTKKHSFFIVQTMDEAYRILESRPAMQS